MLDDAIKVIDRWLDYQVYSNEIPGLSVGIIRDGEVLLAKGYGYADIAKKIPATEKTCYRIASISKTFTAIAIMQLMEQEKLKLDDAVCQYLDWFRSEKDPIVGDITLRQLLSHTAGVTRDGSTAHWENDEFPSVDDLKAEMKHGIAVFKPLEEFKYSNWGYAILGQVIETVSGISYPQYIEKNIIKKIGLAHTSVELSDANKNLIAKGYGRKMPGKEREVFPYVDSRAMASAAGIASNVEDLCVYMQALMIGNESVLKDSSKQEMQRTQSVGTDEPVHYGLGYELVLTEGRWLYGHGAGYTGYLGSMRMDAERKIGVVCFVNCLGISTWGLMNGIYNTLDYFYTKKDEADAMEQVENGEKYEGRFSDRWNEVEVVSLEKGLYVFSPADSRPMEEIVRLEPLSSTTFKIHGGSKFDSPGENVTFQFDSRNQLESIVFASSPMKKFRETV